MLDATDLKRMVKMETVLAWYGLEPDRAGFLPCPFHKDKDPSLKVYPDSGGWHCFGCGAGSDLIDFVMKMESLTFLDAVQVITDRAGLSGHRSLRRDKYARNFTKQFKQKEIQKKNKEIQYWLSKVQGYDRVMASATEWTPELAEACQNKAYAEYRLEVAQGLCDE